MGTSIAIINDDTGEIVDTCPVECPECLGSMTYRLKDSTWVCDKCKATFTNTDMELAEYFFTGAR